MNIETETEDTVITLKMSRGLKARCEKFAKRNETSFSGAVRRFVMEGLERADEENTSRI